MDAPSFPSRNPALSVAVVAGGGLFLGLTCVVLPAVGVIAAIAVPNFIAMQLKAKRAEVPTNLDGLRAAELAYDATFGGFLPCGSRGAADTMLSVDPHAWADDPAAACFRQLGWAPDGAVRGSYWVTVDASTGDFTAYGIVDADGDGDQAEYRASRDASAAIVTWAEVY
jgi:hypothetical protein